jgi:hypothetical protein
MIETVSFRALLIGSAINLLDFNKKKTSKF